MKNFRQSTIVIISFIAFVFCGSLFVSQPKDGTYRIAATHQNLRRLATQSEIGSPDRRNLAGYDNIRKGKCSEVKYGNLTWDDELDPSTLSVNELMIYLDHPAYVSPPNKYGADDLGPVIVDIGLYIHQIKDVDVGFDTFFMEGFVDLVWCDTRLKFEPTVPHKNRHYYLEADAAKELEEIWWPDLTFVNEIGKREIENQELIIEHDGTVEYREKFAVHLSSKCVTTQFPFDKQRLTAEIESFAWNSTTLQFHVEEDLVGFSEDFRIPGFNLTEIAEYVVNKKEARDRYKFSDLVTEFYVERDPSFYVTKVLIPLCLIVAISWSVLWMDGWELGDRMAISFTGILTAVAYQFIISDILPSHVSDTFLDNFILLAFVNLVLTVIINIVVHRGHTNGYVNEAVFIDKVCRILFPVMFILGSFCLVMVQLFGQGLPTGAVLGVALASLLTVLGVIAVYFRLQRRGKQQIRKVARFLGSIVEPEHVRTSRVKSKLESFSYDSDDQSRDSFFHYKGVKAMIKKKDDNIDDAQFKINSLQKQLNDEKMRRQKLIEKREFVRASEDSNIKENREKLVAELDLDIQKKKDEIHETAYRISSLRGFVKSQESVRMSLMKQKNEMVELNLCGVDKFSDIESEDSTSIQGGMDDIDFIEQEAIFCQHSEDIKRPTNEQEDEPGEEKNTTSLRQRKKHDSTTDGISLGSTDDG